MPKIKPSDALEEVERDDIGQCASCSALAVEGDKYCFSCKTYWEEDVPNMERTEWERQQMEEHFRKYPHV